MKNINKIIINFPTNIGDAILTLPALDRIKANFPESKITAIVSLKTKGFLCKNSFIDDTILFNKRWKILDKISFCLSFRKRFDLMVDFKNSMLPIFLGVKKRTPFIRHFQKRIHSKDKHLSIIKKIAPKPAGTKGSFLLSEAEKKKWDFLKGKKCIFFGCFSRSHRKEYPPNDLKEVVDKVKHKNNCVLLGLAGDKQKLQLQKDETVVDLIGKTSMADVYYLLSKNASLTIAVDSSIMHLSSYLEIPVIALFGPTEPSCFGPWSKDCLILKNEGLGCIPCEGKKECDHIQCMNIEPARIIKEVNDILRDE
jgi:ADP-heptose:LPS heptosyltransferase